MEYRDLKHYALEYKDSLRQVDTMLAEETHHSDFEFVNQAANHMSLYQGKRLRPLLVLAVAKCYGPVTTGHIRFAVVAELLHTATLLHDDVLDEADMRRHIKNVKSEWGNQTSVLLGDYLFARSFRILSQLENQEVFSLISQTAQEICEGELLQTSYTWKTDITQSLYKIIIQKKTAELFAASCMGSAILSGVPHKQIIILGEYGKKIGMAFQVTDDILDLAGDSIYEGKTLGTDLKKGKITLPIIHLLENLDKDKRKDLEAKLKDKSLVWSDEQVKALVLQAGQFTKTLAFVSELCHEAQGMLSCFPSQSFREMLSALAQYIFARVNNRLTDVANTRHAKARKIAG